MAVTTTYPGVYIEEFAPAAPIQGAGTSTAAFLGINGRAEPNRPILVTSWDGFLAQFGSDQPPEDDDYLWYGVRGYFQNGGTVCFVTAVSNSRADSAELTDQAQPTAAATIRLRARQRGQLSPPIQVTAAAAHTVASAQLFEPKATIATTAADRKSVDVEDDAHAAQFRTGDRVVLGAGSTAEKADVAGVLGKTVRLTAALQRNHDGKALRLADLEPRAKTFRLKGAAGLVPGSIVTFSQQEATSVTTLVEEITAEPISGTLTTHRVTVRDGISGLTLYKTDGSNNPVPVKLQSEEFDLTIAGQDYAGLSMNPGHPRHYLRVINEAPDCPVWAEPVSPPNITPLPANRPTGTFTLADGASHDPEEIRQAPVNHYNAALAALEGIGDVSLLVADTTALAVQKALVGQCERLADRFAILDAARGSALEVVQTQRQGLESPRGYGALYHPWIETISRKTGQRIPVPPSGHLAGIYSRTDNRRGVHKAPAGTEATVRDALGVERVLSDAEQGILNPEGINVIRVFQHGGVPVVWGARTTSPSTNWQYVNIRRLFIFLEESIQQGIRGSVFEPNNPSLWQALKRTIGAFLTRQWQDGALFGNRAEEAFYVRIDEVLNPDSERALGRLTIEIGVRPSYPAEFIVVRIGIWDGGTSVTES